MKRNAVLSADGRYRYSLTREWEAPATFPGGRLLWVMLNPSTADAEQDDATLRRIIDFSQRWGYGSLEVVNLFALRSTDPAMLGQVDLGQAIGPECDFYIARAAARASRIICAWGAHKTWGRARMVEETLRKAGHDLFRLAATKSGHPVHPLRQPKDRSPELWVRPSPD